MYPMTGKAKLLFNIRPYETRMVRIKEGRLEQILYHRAEKTSHVGAIYKGRVSKIFPGLRFGFIDIGFKKSGFLYGKDLLQKKKKSDGGHMKPRSFVLVQVTSDPVGGKGLRLSTRISFADPFLVYLPTSEVNKVTCSRRITDEKERDRLQQIVEGFEEPGTFIVRTLASGRSEQDLKKSLAKLKCDWELVKKEFETQKGVSELFPPENPLKEFVMNFIDEEVGEIWVDDKVGFQEISSFLKEYWPNWKSRILRHKDHRNLFTAFQLERQIANLHQKTLRLKNGGFLVFEELEAFVVIDVNSGRYLGEKTSGKSLLEMNLESAKVIAEQIRLRHLSGIILIDFIDMENPEDEKRVHEVLEREFAIDRANTQVFPMGELGLIQITRKRTHFSLSRFSKKECSHCQGQGRRKSPSTVACEIFRKAEGYFEKGRFLKKSKNLEVFCHPEVKDWIEQREGASIRQIKSELSLSLNLKSETYFSPEDFKIKETS